METTPRLNPGDFRRALLATRALGALPALLVKVAALAKEPTTDLNRVCDLIRNDSALVADFIRLSNSSYYAPARPHSNLASAVGQIGLREVVRVVNLSLARRLFARDLACYRMNALNNWSSAVATALVTEALAKQVGLDPEDAHTIGILHALGRVFIDQAIRDLGLPFVWDGRQPLPEWEREAVGCDYAEAGALLLERWRFPPTIYEVIRDQLRPAVADNPLSLLVLLQFSQRVLDCAGLSLKRPGWTIPDSEVFLRAAQMTSDSLHQMVRVCRASFVSILGSLGLG